MLNSSLLSYLHSVVFTLRSLSVTPLLHVAIFPSNFIALIPVLLLLVCFFQAEYGIRGYKVTGVQTCALPIWKARRAAPRARGAAARDERSGRHGSDPGAIRRSPGGIRPSGGLCAREPDPRDPARARLQIGRASCRVRVEGWEVIGEPKVSGVA